MLSSASQKVSTQQISKSKDTSSNRVLSDKKINENYDSHARSPLGKNATNAGDFSSPSFGLTNFSSISILPRATSKIQTKLKINQPGDKYEQEADKVADQIMRMPSKLMAASSGDAKKPNRINTNGKMVQRKCSACGKKHKPEDSDLPPTVMPKLCPKCSKQKDPQIQTKRIKNTIQRRMETLEEEEDSGTIRTKRNVDSVPSVTPEINSDIRSIEGGGQPMSKSDRNFFEPRFGVDFSGVRIHNDARSAQLAKSINARAFTLGNNIVFGSGEYASNNSSRRLFAHELTHTIQQSSGVDYVQRGSAGLFGGKCCNPSPRVEWALVGSGTWKKLEYNECTGTTEDCDGMTCGGGFYYMNNLSGGRCSSPRNDDATFMTRRWTPSGGGANGRSPTQEGSTGGDTPPNWAYDSAATTACPDGIRTISVDSIRLHGSTSSPSAMMTAANRIYTGCCVRFVAGASPRRETEAKTKSWLGGNIDLNASGIACDSTTTEEKNMFDGGNGDHRLSSRMRVFYVQTYSGFGGSGYSRPQFCALGSASPYVNHVVLTNNTNTTDLAHEFGHILLNSGNHHSSSSNFMFATNNRTTSISSTQCATIYGNA